MMLALTLQVLFLLGAVVSFSPTWASAVAVPDMEDARPAQKSVESHADSNPLNRKVDFEDAAPAPAKSIKAYSRGHQPDEGHVAAAQTSAVNESEKETQEPTETLAAAVGAVRSRIAAAQKAQLEAEREAGRAKLAAHLEAKMAARKQAAMREVAAANVAGRNVENVPAVHTLRLQLDAAQSAQTMLQAQNAQLVEEVDGWQSAAAQISAHEARAAKLLTERAVLLRRAEGMQEEQIMSGAAAAAIANSPQLLATLGVVVALASFWLMRPQQKAGLEAEHSQSPASQEPRDELEEIFCRQSRR